MYHFAGQNVFSDPDWRCSCGLMGVATTLLSGVHAALGVLITARASMGRVKTLVAAACVRQFVSWPYEDGCPGSWLPKTLRCGAVRGQFKRPQVIIRPRQSPALWSSAIGPGRI